MYEEEYYDSVKYEDCDNRCSNHGHDSHCCERDECCKKISRIIIIIGIAIVVVLIAMLCMFIAYGSTSSTPQYIGLSCKQTSDLLPNSRTVLTFSDVEAENGANISAEKNSSIQLAANHTFYISYNVNVFSANGDFCTLTTGILVDGKEAKPSISTNGDTSLFSTAGGIIVETTAQESVALYTIATGDVNLLNAQMTIVQLD